ncbi:MAG: peptide chain release factor N(5)-glutamine methyltransferase [Bacteroidales bacterium]|nr:peptide chain release factor N(5)-glutamine methyltransferase [Clostridium sp.]MCM1203951.1 peptide chain release factor N(5)-glutamine methyltransferase [Bacteroidales bacterium]
MATIQELLCLGKDRLEKSGNEYAKYERKALLEEVLGVNYMYMLMHGDEEVPGDKEERYNWLLEQRCRHYPLQYLLGYAHFMDYTFFVNEHVLIPRNDTEILVETASAVLEDWERKGSRTDTGQLCLLDLCCGTGCIGISLKLYYKKLRLTLSDVSAEAVRVAGRNLEKYGLDAEVLCGNLFEGVSEKQDIIVSNPPYIETGVVDTLMPEVREHEPRLALDGGGDGLDFYREIVKTAPQYLHDGGWLFLETGCNQKEPVSALMKENGFRDIEAKKDYAGLDRVVYAHL